MNKSISILGSTGSIGTQTLEVARKLELSVTALSAYSSIGLLEAQVREFTFLIADEISRILKEKKMTQKEFAKLVCRSEAEVCRWVGGTHNFTLSTLALISTALKTPLIMIPK